MKKLLLLVLAFSLSFPVWAHGSCLTILSPFPYSAANPVPFSYLNLSGFTGDISCTNGGNCTVTGLEGNALPANAAGALTNNGGGVWSYVNYPPLITYVYAYQGGGENPQVQGSTTGGVTCDPASGATCTISLYNNWTAIAVTVNASHLAAGQIYRYIFIQPSANPYGGTPTFSGPTIRWAGGSAPTLTNTANKADVMTCLYSGGLSALLCDIDQNF
jgi:hypothetical protein